MCKKGYSKIVHILLKHNGDPNKSNISKKSPVYAASWRGFTESVKTLLSHKSYHEKSDKTNDSPLLTMLIVSALSHTEIVKNIVRS